MHEAFPKSVAKYIVLKAGAIEQYSIHRNVAFF